MGGDELAKFRFHRVGPEDLLNIVHVHFDKVQVTEPGFVLDALSPEVSRTPEGGINESDRLMLGTHKGRRNGDVFFIGLGHPS